MSAIASLSDYQLAQGMRRIVNGGKTTPPSLPEFMKACRTVGHDDAFDDGPRMPALPPPDSYSGDKWDVAADLHLLAHIRRVMSDDPRKYGHLGKNGTGWTDEFEANVKRLVAAKNQWAADMRDVARHTGGSVDVEVQREAWRDYMRAAEAEIAEVTA